MDRIGWIGLGLMGSRMLPHLIERGYQATVYDKYAPLADPLIALGATAVGCPADVAAASDIVFTIVATPPDVEAVYLGPDGLFSAARPGQVFVDMTSSSTELARRLAVAGGEAGIGILDAPVSGGPAGAETASLSIMVGGDTEVLARVRPLLEYMGGKVVHHGAPGTGQSMKITNQIAMAGAMMGVCESFLFAKANGLDQQVVFDTLDAGIAGSPLLRYIWPRLASRDMEPGFRVEHLLKDLGLALDAAHDATIALPGTALVKELYHEVRAAGYAGKGTQALIAALDRHWEDDADPA
jgi:3-hydroxyisobutyrate dehydrogenase